MGVDENQHQPESGQSANAAKEVVRQIKLAGGEATTVQTDLSDPSHYFYNSALGLLAAGTVSLSTGY